MPADVRPYLSKITWEHRNKPKYAATIHASIKPIAEITEFLRVLYEHFDLDVAVGVQLDAVGVRVGRNRFINSPIMYFSVEIEGFGINEGNLKGPHDPSYGQHPLADEPYRQVLYATVAANNWDGSIPGAYACYDILYINNVNEVLIQDYGDMSMAVVLYGRTPTPTDFYTREQTIALFTTNHLNLKPAGVKMYFLTLATEFPLGIDAGGPPAFGVGITNNKIAGIQSGHILKTVRIE